MNTHKGTDVMIYLMLGMIALSILFTFITIKSDTKEGSVPRCGPCGRWVE